MIDPDVFNRCIKCLCAALELRTEDVITICAREGLTISKSRAHGWAVGADNKNYRRIQSNEFETFCRGLIDYERD